MRQWVSCFRTQTSLHLLIWVATLIVQMGSPKAVVDSAAQMAIQGVTEKPVSRSNVIMATPEVCRD